MSGDAQSQRVSLAVWEVPATVVAGRQFAIKAGAKSSVGASLHGRRIEACDAAGAVVASAELDAQPWPGTAALHWAELALPAPTQPGLAFLSVRLAGADGTPQQRDATARFAVMVVPPPAHTVTIRVVAQETAAPVAGADIRLGPYRATTAASGEAQLRVAAGEHQLHVWKVGYDAAPRAVTVDRDTAIEIAAAIVPEENADRAWRA